MRYYFTIILALITTVIGQAQNPKQPTIRTRLAVDTIMIGDQITMEVDIRKDIATEIMVPDFKDGKIGPDVEIIGMPSIDTTDRDGRSVNVRLSYIITSFKAGTHRLGGFPLVYTDRGKNDTIEAPDVMQLVVETYDIDTTTMQIADIKPPLQTPLQWAEIKELVLYSAAGVVVLAVLIYFLIKYIKSRKRKTTLRPDEPPHITAIRELEKLHNEKLPQSGRFKEYYSRITDVLREYMDGRYGIWAMEMTTPQIIEALKEVNEEKMVAKLGELFSLADLVKFAKWTPSVDECEEAYQTAYYYIEETKVLIINKNVSEDA